MALDVRNEAQTALVRIDAHYQGIVDPVVVIGATSATPVCECA